MAEINELVEKVYNKYPEDNDIWLLLQEVVSISQAMRDHKKRIENIEAAIRPIMLAEVVAMMQKENEGGDVDG